jgi:hypothetical protein
MKPLVKPSNSEEVDNKYEALDECGCHQACNNKYYADDDKDDILF